MGDVTGTRFLGDAEALRDEFINRCEWAEQIILCVPGLTNSDETECPVWNALRKHAGKIRHLFCSAWDLDVPDLELFIEHAAVKLIDDPWQRFLANAAWFRKGEEIILIVVSSAFGPDLFKNSALVSAVVHHGARYGEVSLSFLSHVDACLSRSRLASLDDLGERGNTNPLRPPVAGISHLELISEAGDVEKAHESFVRLFREAAKHSIRQVQESAEGQFLDQHFEVETRLYDQQDQFPLRLIDRREANVEPVKFYIQKSAGGNFRAGYARDPATGRVYMVTIGRTYSATMPVRPKHFWAHTRYQPVHMRDPDGDETRVAVICEVGSVQQLEHLAAFVHEVRKIRAKPETVRFEQPFYALTEEAGVEKLHQYLLGHGVLGFHEAVCLAAKHLRKDGLLKYRALRRSGEIYQTVQSVLELGCTQYQNAFKKIPRRKIKAVQPRSQDFTPEQWDRCLSRVIREHGGELLSEETLIREAAARARDDYGLEYVNLGPSTYIWLYLKDSMKRAVKRKALVKEKGEYRLHG